MLPTLKRIVKEHVNRILNEIHYEDLYPPEFVEFRKKYLQLTKQSKYKNLYVQFTDYAPTKRHKTPYAKPDHSDFVGIYGYPLTYVLKYPADIWYGRNAARLRVLEDTSQKTLWLNYMTWREAESLVFKLGFHSSLLEVARKHFKHTGQTMAGKCFLSVLQYKLDEPPIKDNSGRMIDKRPDYAIRTGKEQTDLLLKLGFDSVKDTSTNNKQAVINSREPEQICFLTRSSFKVIDIVNFTQPQTDSKFKSLAFGVRSHEDNEKLFAEKILNGIDDSMEGVPRQERSHIYFSQKGRKLEIDFQLFDTYRAGFKFGEKKHRFDRLNTKDSIIFRLSTERGEIKYHSSPKEKVKDVVKAIQEEFYGSKEIEGWEPLTLEKHEKMISDQKAIRYREEKLKSLPDILESVRDLAKFFGLPWADPGPVGSNFALCLNIETLCNFAQRSLSLPKDNFSSAWPERVDLYKIDESELAIKQLKSILMEYVNRFRSNPEVARMSSFDTGVYWALQSVSHDDDHQEQSQHSFVAEDQH